jgi:hypothetical protein
MAPVSMVFGALLIAVGLAGYFGTGTPSLTALIPAGIGAALLLLGLVALNEGLRKHAMHLAAMVGLLGAVGALVRPVRTLLAGGEVANVAALASQLVTAGLCVVFVGLCVNSFVQARRRRAAAAGEPAAT